MGRKVSKFSPTLFLSTFFYTGLISKKAPGTVGSFFASLSCVLLNMVGLSNRFLIITVISAIIGIYSSHVFLFEEHGDINRDPGYIVIDEACGIFLGAAVLNYFGCISVFSLLMNLIFFRVFDIWKPFPIKNIDKLFKNSEKTAAFGIMLDDIIASLYGTAFQLILYNYI